MTMPAAEPVAEVDLRYHYRRTAPFGAAKCELGNSDKREIDSGANVQDLKIRSWSGSTVLAVW